MRINSVGNRGQMKILNLECLPEQPTRPVSATLRLSLILKALPSTGEKIFLEISTKY
jgi:hypothetical protein